MIQFALLSTLLFLEPGPGTSRHTVVFDGVAYTRAHVNRQSGSSIAEYVKSGETIDAWTTLVAVHAFPKLNDPGRAAAGVIRQLQKSNPDARFQFLEKPDHSEVMIDFITWPKDASYAEFNVFRYLKRPGTPGLVAYQFAWRFTDSSPENADRVRSLRQAWVDAMAAAEFPVDFAD